MLNMCRYSASEYKYFTGLLEEFKQYLITVYFKVYLKVLANIIYYIQKVLKIMLSNYVKYIAVFLFIYWISRN